MSEQGKGSGHTSAPPRTVAVSTVRPDLRYELVDELDEGQANRDSSAGIREAETLSEARETSHLVPVYRRVPGGEKVVPTGRLLVRFNEGDTAADHADDLRNAGYVVEQVLPYAAHTAWVRALTGGVAAALRDLDLLSVLPGVVAVEPQMIGQRSKRT